MVVNFDLLPRARVRLATAATVVIKSLSFNEKEELLTHTQKNPRELLILWRPKTQFRKLIESII